MGRRKKGKKEERGKENFGCVVECQNRYQTHSFHAGSAEKKLK